MHPPAVSTHPRLRLVGGDAAAGLVRDLRRAVAEENLAAAHSRGLDPADPRWRLAMTTAGLLDGAALPPDRRARVLRTAQQLGVRLFDANLIIAVVQDAARRGEPIEAARGTIALVPAGRQRGRGDRRVSKALLLLMALLAAVGAQLGLIAWLFG